MGIKRKILLICGNDSSDEHNPKCAQQLSNCGNEEEKAAAAAAARHCSNQQKSLWCADKSHSAGRQACMHGGLVVLVQHYNQAYTNVHSFKCRKLDFWLDCRTCFSACGGFRSCCCLWCFCMTSYVQQAQFVSCHCALHILPQNLSAFICIFFAQGKGFQKNTLSHWPHSSPLQILVTDIIHSRMASNPKP